MLFVIFFFMLAIISYTVRESVNMQKHYRLINRNINGMKIYIRKGDNFVYNVLKKYGAVPLEVEVPMKSYNLNKYKRKVNGYVYDNINLNKILLEGRENIGLSNVISQMIPVGFPINKKDKKLKIDINKIIKEIKVDDKIYASCQKIYNKNLLC
jgi:hypothetical protein